MNQAVAGVIDERSSRSGVLISLALLLIALSAFPTFRPDIGGLSLHPYVIGVALLVPGAVRNLRLHPRVMFSAGAFIAAYAVSMVPAGFVVGEIVKLLAAALTALVVAGSVRNERDVVLVATALVAAAAFMGLRGLTSGPIIDSGVSGINPMDGIGNKNSYSLYALPSLLIAGFAFTTMRVPRRTQLVIAVASVAVVIAMFSTANRSGWLGVIAVGLMLLWGRLSVRSFALVAAGAVGVWLLLTVFGGSTIVERKIDQTREGYESDEVRIGLVVSALEVGVDNPILGVGPQALPHELALRTRSIIPNIDPHNVLGHVVGGCGLMGIGTLVALWVSLWFIRRRSGPGVDQVVFLIRMLTLLWIFRGMFSREVLYAPCFAAAIGAAIGLLRIREERAAALERRAAIAARKPVAPVASIAAVATPSPASGVT